MLGYLQRIINSHQSTYIRDQPFWDQYLDTYSLSANIDTLKVETLEVVLMEIILSTLTKLSFVTPRFSADYCLVLLGPDSVMAYPIF